MRIDNHGKKRIADEGKKAVYSDVVRSGLILPKKARYTKADFSRLVREGWNDVDERFIVRCSAAYHDAKESATICNASFLAACEYGHGMAAR